MDALGRLGRRGNHVGMRAEYLSWEEVSVRIRGIPSHTRTLDIWLHFGGRADITYIRIINELGRPVIARIRFAPPPPIPVWKDMDTILIRGQSHRVTMGIEEPPRQTRKIQTERPGVEYDAKTTLISSRIHFGFLIKEREMVAMRTIGNTRDSVEFDLQFKQLCFKFSCNFVDPRQGDPTFESNEPIGQLNRTSFYKARIPFQLISQVHCIDHGADGAWSILLHLPSPPEFFRKLEGDAVLKTHSADRSTWYDDEAWVRTQDIMYDPRSLRNKTTMFHTDGYHIDIGRWTTYRIDFDDAASRESWKHVSCALTDLNVLVTYITAHEFPTVHPSPSFMNSITKFWNRLDANFTDDDHASLLALLEGNEDFHLPFDVRYQLEVCISRGVFHETDITLEFLHQLLEVTRKCVNHRRNRAADLLAYASDEGKRMFDPMLLFKDKNAMLYWPTNSIPSYCQWVRKVVVTPTTMYLSTPTAETTNRVLRHFSNYADRFIRVQFLDEKNRGRIWAEPESDKNNLLFARVFRTLRNGLDVAGRHFEFLAYGNSQFREHGAYFFSPDETLTCDMIRDWMGDFNHIRVVAKYASRLGQCFSTTRVPDGLGVCFKTRNIPDIERGSWCFSDGVGKISTYMAGEISRRLKIGFEDKLPSAFQFRLGGHKGILVTWPDVQFNEIHLRPSQKKFNAAAKGIEIVKASRSANAYLNRQTITILSDLGIPRDYIMGLLRDQTSGYEQALRCEQKAETELKRHGDENGILDGMIAMIHSGFMSSKEPFFISILKNWRTWALKQLKEKARILVEQGTFVFGCVDETHSLRGHDSKAPRGQVYPQIFLQVQVPEPKTPRHVNKDGKYSAGNEDDDLISKRRLKYQVITGTCVVGRNPSLHPGDLRVVEAVDVPALRHLHDVVVFPSTGDRDLASMCSGGDLDGDEFFVFWDQNLIPEQKNFEPLHHDAVKPEPLNRDVEIKDICKFFVSHMKNDSLANIALAHLATADKVGARDPKCIDLAKLHSNAVDYVKTGLPARLTKDLRPKEWPHYMNRKSKTYHSKTIVGSVYDFVDNVQFTPEYETPFDIRILTRYNLDATTLDKASEVKREYDGAMRRIMSQRDIATEFEVWTTLVLSKPKVGSDYKVQEDMATVRNALRDRFFEAGIEAAGLEKDDSRMGDKMLRFVAACYQVTWQQVEDAKRHISSGFKDAGGKLVRARSPSVDNMPFLSFPWVFEDELRRIARSDPDKRELRSLPIHRNSWSNTKECSSTDQPLGSSELVDEQDSGALSGAADSGSVSLHSEEQSEDNTTSDMCSKATSVSGEEAMVEEQLKEKPLEATVVEQNEELVEDEIVVETGMDALIQMGSGN